MTPYILILTFYAGMLSDHDSVAMIHQEFTSEQTCQAAGDEAKNKFKTLMKNVNYICVKK